MSFLLRFLSLITGKRLLTPAEAQVLSNKCELLESKNQALEKLAKQKEAELQQGLLKLENARFQDKLHSDEKFKSLSDQLITLRARYDQLVEQSDAVSMQWLSENEALLQQLNWLSGTIAHDFRAPLRAIDANCFFLESDLPEDTPEDARKLLSEVQRNGRRMGVLIDGLLDFLRIGISPMTERPLNLIDVIKKVIDTDFDLQPTPITVTGALGLDIIGDEAMLSRLFKELIDNALKFSRPVESPRVTVDIADSGIVKVIDNGVGFNEAHRGQLMQLFHRLHGNDEFAGEGIGLSIAQRISQRHFGQLDLECHDGQTTATVTFGKRPNQA